MTQRGPLEIMLSVWKALFLREASVRLFGARAAWVWLFVEPLVHVAFISYLFSVIRQREVAGIGTVIFLVLGLFGFFQFRRTAQQMGNAIASNRALFTYRQVTPFDPIIVRGFLELTIMTFALFFTLCGMALLEFEVVPAEPLRLAAAYAALWLLGTGLGLVIAVLGEIVAELRKVFQMAMLPLYFLSAIIFPIMIIPAQYREILMLNPILHGTETMRIAFSPHYVSAPGVDLAYSYLWAAALWGVGLLLYRSFSDRVVAE